MEDRDRSGGALGAAALAADGDGPDRRLDPNAALGLWIFLASTGMLFAASVAGFLWVRVGNDAWAGGLASRHAWSLVAATACLIGADLCVSRARLGAALALGAAYATVQSWNWTVLAPALEGEAALEAFTFVLLTGLHAAHVLGGMVHVALMLARRTPAGATELTLAGRYWRFLSCVWLSLVALLAIA